MKFKIILNITGSALKYVSFVFLLPPLFALFYKEYSAIAPFLTAGLVTYWIGSLFLKNDVKEEDIDMISRIEALIAVFFTWFMFCIVCLIPFLFFNLSFIDSLFEAVSGVSTTGATILYDFSLYPKTFFLYRSLMQWFGGMGIIVLFIAVLPKFKVAGRQMFFAETPSPVEEKITPRVRYTASWLWSIYFLLTLIQIAVLKFQGLDFYDSLCISLSTISAGGFSSSSTSLLNLSPNIIWTIGIFAFLSGVNFLLTYKVLIKGKISELFKNEEFKAYLFIVLISTVLIAAILYFGSYSNLSDSFRNAFFETAATITSTGSSSDDYIKWPLRARIVLFALMFIGASAMSASGGIKITRWIYIVKFIKNELKKIAHPNAVFNIKIENRIVTPEVGHQIFIFIMFFILIFAVSTLLIACIEQDAIIALTGSISCLSNTGPAFESSIGPLGGYYGLHPVTKLILIFNMLAGRLEIIPILALFQKELWKIRK